MNKLKIIAGSIQSTVFCYDFIPQDSDFQKIFTINDHVGKLKDLHVTSEQLLISSGEDENVKVYDLKKNQKLSNIFGIDGVTNRILSSKKFIIAATEKGTVYIIGKKDFAIYYKLVVFKNPCIDMSLHPSGLFLICLSSMNRFSFWDLTTCEMIFHKKIKKNIERTLFIDEENILLTSRNSFLIFNLKQLSLTHEINLEKSERINSV